MTATATIPATTDIVAAISGGTVDADLTAILNAVKARREIVGARLRRSLRKGDPVTVTSGRHEGAEAVICGSGTKYVYIAIDPRFTGLGAGGAWKVLASDLAPSESGITLTFPPTSRAGMYLLREGMTEFIEGNEPLLVEEPPPFPTA